LLGSIPDLEGIREELEPIPGNPPSLLNPPSGCPFRPRCSMAIDVCREATPELLPVGTGHASRCHRANELAPLSTGAPS
jgi:oligopeptide/dipeptide ABC transporter ATP-binding protein